MKVAGLTVTKCGLGSERPKKSGAGSGFQAKAFLAPVGRFIRLLL